MMKGHGGGLGRGSEPHGISQNVAEERIAVIKASPADMAFKHALDWNSHYRALGSDAFLSLKCVMSSSLWPCRLVTSSTHIHSPNESTSSNLAAHESTSLLNNLKTSSEDVPFKMFPL